jgi:hypothetical protein
MTELTVGGLTEVFGYVMVGLLLLCLLYEIFLGKK